MISEDLKRHIASGRDLINSEFRYGSEKWAGIIREARRLYRLGILDDISLEDYHTLEADVGEQIGYEGTTVLLEVPYPIHTEPGSYFVYVLDNNCVQKINFQEDGTAGSIEHFFG